MADSGFDGLGAGGLDGFQPMVENSAKNLHELTVAILVPLQLGTDLRQGGRQVPVLERRAVAQCPRLLAKNRR